MDNSSTHKATRSYYLQAASLRLLIGDPHYQSNVANEMTDSPSKLEVDEDADKEEDEDADGPNGENCEGPKLMAKSNLEVAKGP